MDWQEICVKTDQKALEAVAEAFCELGSGGVIIEDRKLQEEDIVLVKGYLPFDEAYPAKLIELKNKINLIARRLDKEVYEISTSVVDDEDWATSWKKYFKPLRVGQRVIIRPTWEEYTPEEGDLVLDIDPGMAFGTGSHASTSLCVSLLEKYIEPGITVIDIGTGTGILGMCAARLGAQNVFAIDNDPVAVKVAKENIAQNNLAEKVNVARGNLLQGVEAKGQLITANIVADVILELLPQTLDNLISGGIFIASGIISERKPEIITAAEKKGYRAIEEKEESGWTAIAFRLKE